MRTGAEYREALRDGRRVWVMGEGWAGDVTAHPATRAMVEEYAAWYDRHLDPAWQEVLLAPLAAAVVPDFGFVLLNIVARDSPNDCLLWLRRTRSCGRVGPARLGSTVCRSSTTVSEYAASGESAVWNRPCSLQYASTS